MLQVRLHWLALHSCFLNRPPTVRCIASVRYSWCFWYIVSFRSSPRECGVLFIFYQDNSLRSLIPRRLRSWSVETQTTLVTESSHKNNIITPSKPASQDNSISQRWLKKNSRCASRPKLHLLMQCLMFIVQAKPIIIVPLRAMHPAALGQYSVIRYFWPCESGVKKTFCSIYVSNLRESEREEKRGAKEKICVLDEFQLRFV